MQILTPRALRSALIGLVFLLAYPTVASAQAKWFDLTPGSVVKRAAVEQVLLFRVGGIVLGGGTTSDRSTAFDARGIATFLTYERVATLMVVAPAGDFARVKKVH